MRCKKHLAPDSCLFGIYKVSPASHSPRVRSVATTRAFTLSSTVLLVPAPRGPGQGLPTVPVMAVGYISQERDTPRPEGRRLSLLRTATASPFLPRSVLAAPGQEKISPGASRAHRCLGGKSRWPRFAPSSAGRAAAILSLWMLLIYTPPAVSSSRVQPHSATGGLQE